MKCWQPDLLVRWIFIHLWRGIVVSPIYCTLHLLQDIRYTRFCLWQLIALLEWLIAVKVLSVIFDFINWFEMRLGQVLHLVLLHFWTVNLEPVSKFPSASESDQFPKLLFSDTTALSCREFKNLLGELALVGITRSVDCTDLACNLVNISLAGAKQSYVKYFLLYK